MSDLSRLHAALFFATLITISAAGLIAAGLEPFAPGQWTAAGLFEAASYALWMLAIIAAHEAGHYVIARRRGVQVSKPYFLPGLGPIPGVGVIPFFGTFGAFIRMELKKLRAVDLMAIAGWGPVAGFVVTVPAVLIGVALSEPMQIADDAQLLLLGDSLLIQGASALFHPDLAAGEELMLHPIALAGWVGCLLTALNLLPMGQLDGGHLAYGVLGEKAKFLSIAAMVVMVLLGILVFPGWLFVALLVWWMGLEHPSMLTDGPASIGEQWMAWTCLVIFMLTFTPAPVIVDSIPAMLGWV